MVSVELKNLLFGDKLYQRRARTALPILVRQAIAYQPITYSGLAQEIGMPNPRNLNFPLGCIADTLHQVSLEWEMEIPSINCLAINKTTLLPGDGVIWVDNFVNNYASLPLSQKRKIMDIELMNIYTFPRWLEILDYLDLPYNRSPDNTHRLDAITRGKYGRGGESQTHKKFKEFISQNPSILGLPKSIGNGEVEFIFPSQDVADVLFKHGNEWVVAEVKSHVSDVNDIYRGIYQCIKYQSLVEANQKEKGLSPNSRVVLVLEGKFPDELIVLKHLLQVEIIDEVLSE